MKNRRTISLILSLLLIVAGAFTQMPAGTGSVANAVEASAITAPAYNGEAYKVLNNNEPEFTSTEKKKTTAFEQYSKLDSLGRCGVAYANICKELMPTEPRGDISKIHPTGWQTGVGYNRCHLIGFQLAGENDNDKNLITGTQYFNVTGMLPFENMIAAYVKEEYANGVNAHVLYRVTPVFNGNDLVARGVQMEAWSVEDEGDGICFNVFCYNVFKENNPKINYATGVVGKKDQTISVGVAKKYYASKILKTRKTFSINAKSSTGNISCRKKTGSSRLTITKAGKVSVKALTKKGTYKMTVGITAAGNSSYNKKAVTKTIIVYVGKKAPAPVIYVYWTPSGSCYHKTKACTSLANSKTINSGKESEALNLGKRKCKLCYE